MPGFGAIVEILRINHPPVPTIFLIVILRKREPRLRGQRDRRTGFFSGAARVLRLCDEKKKRTYTSTSGTSICPLRKAATNASTTCGSKSLPAPFMIASLASNGDIALRYGRSLVSES